MDLAHEPTTADQISVADEAGIASQRVALKAALLARAHDAAQAYVASERSEPVAPRPEALAALAEFASVDLDAPLGAEAAIELLDRVGSPATSRTTGGRYFGFVNGGVEPAALAASVIAGAWDQNAALPVMSPVAAAADAAAADMIIDALGLPSTATAAFCGGATVANITAIVTARDALLARVGWDVHADGLQGAPQITVVTSEEAHISVTKALRIAGFGQKAVLRVPTDDCGRLRADQMPETEGPTLVLLQAGNVNTGHSDPFDQIIPTLDRDRSWVHVDGAFGLWANATPARRQHVAGVELADSWATDGHKWLNTPYDCGVVICADGNALRHSMRMEAAYVPSDVDERVNMSLGMQMSQAARGIPVWAVLAAGGRAAVADAIEHSCQAAERFASALEGAGVEVLAPVVLNQALVAFGDDAMTDAVVNAVQEAGECWMGATTWQGRRAMRISVSDTTTTFADVDRSVASILACRDQVDANR